MWTAALGDGSELRPETQKQQTVTNSRIKTSAVEGVLNGGFSLEKTRSVARKAAGREEIQIIEQTKTRYKIYAKATESYFQDWTFVVHVNSQKVAKETVNLVFSNLRHQKK